MSSVEGQTTDSIVTGDDPTSSRSYRLLSRSRPRPVLSCLRCRRRKIKCDRLLPCGQCTLTGHARQCTYSSRPKSDNANGVQTRNGNVPGRDIADAPAGNSGELTSQTAVSVRTESDDSIKTETLTSLQQRLQRLEQLCSSHSHGPTTSPGHEDDNSRDVQSPSSKVDAVLSIKASGPRYHSQNYKKSLFHNFGAVNRFCHTGFDDPERAPAMHELKMYYERFTKARKRNDKAKPDQRSLSSILELLPAREVCDESVKAYFKCFEKNMRILHYPSFMEEYLRFWEASETMRQNSEMVVLQLAAIVAIIQFWKDISTPIGGNEIKADILCGQVELWLDKLAGRRQLTVSALSTRALLILAQQVRGVQADKIWNATGKLVRSAMMAGLHRDPSEFPNITIFDGEIRRRLWMSIIELELEGSLIYGMPVMVRDGDFTCNPPSNVNDIDLFSGMMELPLSKPLHELTDSIFQVALVGSLIPRLQGIAESISQQENSQSHIQSHIQAIERYLQDLPKSLRIDANKKYDFNQRFSIAMLNVYIRRVIAYLYRSSTSPTEMTPEMTTTGLQSSLSILSYQKIFDPKSNSEQDAIHCEKYWDLFHILCKSDIMQAALDVSLHARIEDLVSWTRAGLLLAIDDTTDSLMRRVSRSGSDIKDILRLAVISQFLKSQFTHADSEDMMKEGMHNVVAACRRAIKQDTTLFNSENGNNMTPRVPQSPNSQPAIENGNNSIDWTMVPNDAALPGDDLESFFNMDGVNYDLLSHYTLDNIHGDMWR